MNHNNNPYDNNNNPNLNSGYDGHININNCYFCSYCNHPSDIILDENSINSMGIAANNNYSINNNNDNFVGHNSINSISMNFLNSGVTNLVNHSDDGLLLSNNNYDGHYTHPNSAHDNFFFRSQINPM